MTRRAGRTRMGLEAQRDHYRLMAMVEHKPDCGTQGGLRVVRPDPDCGGCNPSANRAMFAKLADEIDAHLAPPQTDLFGEETAEPAQEPQDAPTQPRNPTTAPSPTDTPNGPQIGETR